MLEITSQLEYFYTLFLRKESVDEVLSIFPNFGNWENFDFKIHITAYLFWYRQQDKVLWIPLASVYNIRKKKMRYLNQGMHRSFFRPTSDNIGNAVTWKFVYFRPFSSKIRGLVRRFLHTQLSLGLNIISMKKNECNDNYFWRNELIYVLTQNCRCLEQMTMFGWFTIHNNHLLRLLFV